MTTPHFEVRDSSIQGRGAFATKRIRKGQRLIEYAGERISNDEADRRYDESKMRRHHTFLFTLDKKTVIDGAVDGNAAIYINHSCEPNCEAIIVGKRIYIHSARAIEPGEELVYDYQYERTDESDAYIRKFYKCLCGTDSCRGTIMMPAKPKRSRKTAKKSSPSSAKRKQSRQKRAAR